MKAVIFIGHFKTGTSSLQRFLARNYVGLRRAGILYPATVPEGIERNRRAFRAGRDEPLVRTNRNINSPHNSLALKLKNEEDGHHISNARPNLPPADTMLDLVDEQVGEVRPESLVLCAETFALLGLTKERASLARLAERLSGHEVTIYCNLRRPDEHLSSWHRQTLKFGRRVGPLRGAGLNRYVGTPHIDQAQMIQAWLDFFPGARLVVRNFDDVRRGGGSIEDFKTHSGLAFPGGLSDVDDINPSVPSAFAEIGRRALRELPRPNGRSVVTWLLAARQRVDHPADRDVEMLGARNRGRLVDMFSPVRERLDRLAGGDFYPDHAEIGRERPVDELETVRAALPALRRDARWRLRDREARAWLKTVEI